MRRLLMKCSALARIAASTVFTLILAAGAPAAAATAIPEPRQAFGFTPGSDRELIDYEQLVAYLKEVDAGSDRVALRQVGRSPEGRPMFVAFFSSPENIRRLDELRALNERLALDPAIPADERRRLVAEGRVFVMMTLSMHSGEVAPSQSLALFAHELATTEDPTTLARLASVVLMVVPCHNPDGMDMVVRHYRAAKDTPFEGAPMPGLYHKYVGHDNNRDFITLSQADTRVVSRLYSTEWFPQVLVEKHQMGVNGPRYFVPPSHDPIAENIDEALWSWAGVFGAGLSRDMGHDGLQGVASHWLFDNYWPGSTETSLWKNVVSFLTEAASARVARPIYVEPTELSVDGKGLSEYKKSTNMPAPWPGGWWRLGDIVKYELSSLRSILKTAAAHREELLTLRNDLCRRAVEAGKREPPYYYVVPRRQHDRGALADLVRLLQEHGVRVFALSERVVVGDRVLEAGDVVVPLSQPYRAFIKEVLELQRYPERHYTPGGELIKPYDIASWSLPAHRGLTAVAIETRSEPLEAQLKLLVAAPREARPRLDDSPWGLGFSANDNDSFHVAFAALGQGLRVDRLTQPLTAGELTLPVGSFVVSGAKREQLEKLVERTDASVVALRQKPAAAMSAQRRPRVGLVETWFHHMDAGWTRFVLDSYEVPHTILRPGDFAAADLKRFDVLVFPSIEKEVLVHGRFKEETAYRIADYPPEFRQGLGKKGIERLVGFIDGGGVVVAWGDSVGVFTDDLKVKRKDEEEEAVRLPVRNVSEERTKQGLFVPGSWLRLQVSPEHPLAWGMAPVSGAFSRGTPVLATALPRQDTDRRVVASYPEDGLLVSGYGEREKLLGRAPAVVWVKKGKGQLALMAFSPQFRASTPATYKLLFNALLLQ